MHIEGLFLKNFRNYEALQVNFIKGFNIIYGNNAQGKTNILEAIYLCSTGRSHRTSKDAELIKNGKEKYIVNVKFTRNEITGKCIEINYDRINKKKIKINENPIKKIGDLMGQINSIMFSPEDLQIIKEGPSERRRFIDIALCQLKPSYFFNLQQYIRILNQRNTLLKEISLKRMNSSTLDVWNQSLIEIGSKIIKSRIEFINILSEKANINHKKITNNEEMLEIKYVPSIDLNNFNIGVEEIKKTFTNQLKVVLAKEIQKATTIIGPQRDDIEIRLNKESIKLYGSQGQQRTAVLSLKLSELEIVKDDTGEFPILLLDDVMSELDMNRREYLVENIK
ncbi:MAG: DNA replication/repair protein RecF, partial [Bacillota bacterium]|nr:DNA replication/repair protein RecF [Bacillota bacterium]